MDSYRFPTEPLANPDSVVAGKNFRFTLISDTILRYEWAHDDVFEDRPSTLAINRRFPSPKFSVSDTESHLEIRTASFQVTYDKKRFSRHGLVVSFSLKNTLWGADWRYGEVTETLGGTARTLDEVEGRCALEPGILSRTGYSTIDDSSSMLFDGNGFVAPRRPGDRIDGYLFCYGHDFQNGMSSFYALSGKQPLLPRWALGNWWSRYFAYNEQQYMDLMARFEKESVPLSVAVVDMDWHQVSGDHIAHAGWTGYSWNKDLFPDPPAFLQKLHTKQLKVTLNDHPHAGIHAHEDLYEQMAKEMDHDTSSQAPILFDSTNPRFMHAYFNTLHRSLENDGCDFWWIDWQQGPYSNIPGLDPLWLLNHFHYLDHKIHGNDRALIFSRFAGPGSHRYPVGFSGDTIMSWESLEFQPEFTATASNIGYGWWSHDIGGHMQGSRDDELVARWVQFGVFSPIMRLHSSNSPWASKEPWLYRKEFASSMKDFLRLRHRLLPYLYTMNHRSAVHDEPLVQPLYWKHPTANEAYRKPNQYYFGTSLVIAPVVRPRERRTHCAKIPVWVPPGRHVDIMNGLVYDGDRNITMYRDIQTLPVLAPEGSIIPLDQETNPINGCLNPLGYEVLVVVGKDAKFVLHEDVQDDETDTANSNAKTSVRDIELGYNQALGALKFNSSGKSWSFRFISYMSTTSSLSVSVDGLALPDVLVKVEDDSPFPGFVVHLPKIVADSLVCLSLGPDPKPSVIDTTRRAHDLILDCQMEMEVKDELWKIFSSSHPPSVKIGELSALGLDEDIIGPLMEMLLADSRSSASDSQ